MAPEAPRTRAPLDRHSPKPHSNANAAPRRPESESKPGSRIDLFFVLSPPAAPLPAQEPNATWKKNRNSHARLLLENLTRGVLEPPFDKRPEDGRVKMLPAHARFPIRASPSGEGANAMHATHRPGARASTPSRARGGGNANIPSPDAATSLRDLLRRAEIAAGAASGDDGAETRRGWETPDEDGHLDVPSVSSPPRPMDDGGRRGAFLGAEMRRWLDGGVGEFESRSDAGTDAASGRVALEAELGAAKERVRELEWRLEKSRKAHDRTKADLDETRRGVVVLQKLRANEKAEMRRAHRRELDDLVVSFERRRAEWAPKAAEKLERAGTSPGTRTRTLARPRWSGGIGIGAGVVRRDANSNARDEEKDFFGYLEKFQRQTDALRRRAEE